MHFLHCCPGKKQETIYSYRKPLKTIGGTRISRDRQKTSSVVLAWRSHGIHRVPFKPIGKATFRVCAPCLGCRVRTTLRLNIMILHNKQESMGNLWIPCMVVSWTPPWCACRYGAQAMWRSMLGNPILLPTGPPALPLGMFFCWRRPLFRWRRPFSAGCAPFSDGGAPFFFCWRRPFF